MSDPFRKKFARHQENFFCETCHTFVHGNGYTNHCPNCLYSKHVDINPGDRSSQCQSMMRPIGKGLDKKGYYLRHQCLKCHMQKRIKLLATDNQNIVDTLPWV